MHADPQPHSSVARRRRLLRHAIIFAALVVSANLGLVIGAESAVADNADPTNYRSTVTDVDPRIDGVRFVVVGGDAYLAVSVAPGHVVEVPGYFNEPYLRVESDGSVFVNRNSPAFVINKDRFGTFAGAVDELGDQKADWWLVADDGRFAWHDHRTHWMSEDRPPSVDGSTREVVFPWQVPAVVDGVPVTVSGELVWIPSRSPAPALMAGLIALLPLAFWTPRRMWIPAATASFAGLVAGGVSVVLISGTPAEVRDVPAALALAVASTAVGLVGVLAALARPRLSAAAAAIAAGCLAAWSATSMAALWLPVLPSASLSAGVRSGVAFVMWAAAGVMLLSIASVIMDRFGPGSHA